MKRKHDKLSMKLCGCWVAAGVLQMELYARLRDDGPPESIMLMRIARELDKFEVNERAIENMETMFAVAQRPEKRSLEIPGLLRLESFAEERDGCKAELQYLRGGFKRIRLNTDDLRDVEELAGDALWATGAVDNLDRSRFCARD